jgi:hypothetical protein
MIHILFLDQDRSYCRQVCSRLNSRSTRYRCLDSSAHKPPIPLPDSKEDRTPQAVDLSQIVIDWSSTLVVYHPQQYFHPPENSHTMILIEIPDAPDRNLPVGGGTIPYLYRYGSIQSMQATIEAYLDCHPGLSAKETSRQLLCVAGAACPTVRKRATDRIRQEKLEQGMKVVQLDFCPPYLGDYREVPPHGYSLSDAFLRLMADDLASKDLGTFLISGPDGTLQFRPFERADDLFECKPAHIRQFVELLREWMAHTTSPYFVFIQCAAIPFSFIYAAAVLCDGLLVVNPDSRSPAAVSYNKELGFLLANLPGSCHMEEVCFPCSCVESAERKDIS